jgi:hypothetical protein
MYLGVFFFGTLGLVYLAIAGLSQNIKKQNQIYHYTVIAMWMWYCFVEVNIVLNMQFVQNFFLPIP